MIFNFSVMRITVILFLFLGISPLTGQNHLKVFLDDLSTTEEFTKWKVPSKNLKSGIKLGFNKTDIESNLNRLLDGIEKVNFYTTEINDMDEEKISRIMDGHKKKLIRQDSFQERLQYKDKVEKVSVLTQEKDQKIIKILVMYQKRFDIQIIDFITNIDKKEFDKLPWKREYKKI